MSNFTNYFITCLAWLNPLTARIFTVFGHNSLLKDIVLHKGAWVAALLGTHLRIQDHKKVKISGHYISFLPIKGLNEDIKIVKKVKIFTFFDSLKVFFFYESRKCKHYNLTIKWFCYLNKQWMHSVYYVNKNHKAFFCMHLLHGNK